MIDFAGGGDGNGVVIRWVQMDRAGCAQNRIAFLADQLPLGIDMKFAVAGERLGAVWHLHGEKTFAIDGSVGFDVRLLHRPGFKIGIRDSHGDDEGLGLV